ncbi:hypothetical protein M0R45_013656 [Rubus argutus]|uniref:Cyclic nucleotide-binding domain-containing protein n=1 Tax=Rubus argutus TaxID=59490 RepID=A0AAW1XJ60_RUBAR
MYIQSESIKALEDQKTRALEDQKTRALEEDQKTKINAKYQDLDTWLSRNGIHGEAKTEVVKIIKQNNVVETKCGDGGDVAVDLVFVFNAIKVCHNIKLKLFEHFCRNALEKVTIFQHRPSLENYQLESLLLEVFDPVSYEKDSYVIQEGKPDDKMLIITDGEITCTYKISSAASTNSMIPGPCFKKGEVYGQELLSKDHVIPKLSTRDVKCKTKVEAFALTADKLKNIDDLENISHDPEKANKAYRVLTTTRSEKMDRKEKEIMEWLSGNGVPDDLQTSVMKHIEANHRHVLGKNLDAEVDVKYLFSIGVSWDIEYHIKKHVCMRTLSKVPVLEWVDENVLHRICMSLEPMIFQINDVVFRPDDEIHWMLIIVEGEIELTEWSAHVPAWRGSVKRVNKGYFCGEELLISAFPDSSISRTPPAISNKYVRCCTKVEAFALTKEGVESVVTYYRDGINKFEQLENGRCGVVDTKGASTSTTTIEQRLDYLIHLQSDMFQQQGRRMDEIAAFLARLGYPCTPPAV